MKLNKQNQKNSNGYISRNYINQFHMEACCRAYNMIKPIFLEGLHS